MKKQVLIVDDDPRNTFALKAVLQSRGYTCVICHSMQDAFTELENGYKPLVILLDMMMPEMDGYTALPLLKKNVQYAQIPVIAVTAQAMKGDAEKCLAHGADDYLSKPVDIDQLEQKLKALLPIE